MTRPVPQMIVSKIIIGTKSFELILVVPLIIFLTYFLTLATSLTSKRIVSVIIFKNTYIVIMRDY